MSEHRKAAKLIPVALAVLVGLQVFFPCSSWSQDVPPPGFTFIGSGANSDVYGNGNSVVKIVRGGDLTRSQIVDLHNDVARQLPGIVPPLQEFGANSALQERVGGLNFDQLSPGARATAEASMRELVGRTDRIMGQVWFGEALTRGELLTLPAGNVAVIDQNPANFKFHDNGLIYKWYDPVFVTTPPNLSQIAGVTPVGAPHVQAPPGTSSTLIPQPLAQKPGVISVTSVAGDVAAKVGLPILAADYTLGVKAASDATLFTSQYLVNFGLSLAGLKAAEYMGTTLMRAVLSPITSAIVARWVGLGVVVGMTGYGAYHLYDTYFAGGSLFVPNGTGIDGVDMTKVGELASRSNGCFSTCAHDLVGESAYLFATGVELKDLMLQEGFSTQTQAKALAAQADAYKKAVSAYVAKVNSAAAGGKKVPDVTQIKQMASGMDSTKAAMNRGLRAREGSSVARRASWGNPATRAVLRGYGSDQIYTNPGPDWLYRSGSGGYWVTVKQDGAPDQVFYVGPDKALAPLPVQGAPQVKSVDFDESLYFYEDGHIERSGPISSLDMGGFGTQWADRNFGEEGALLMSAPVGAGDSFPTGLPSVINIKGTTLPTTGGDDGGGGSAYAIWTGNTGVPSIAAGGFCMLCKGPREK